MRHSHVPGVETALRSRLGRRSRLAVLEAPAGLRVVVEPSAAHIRACESEVVLRAAELVRLEAALESPVSAYTAVALMRIDPTRLSPRDRLRRLQLADRVAGWAAVQAAAALADYVGPAPQPVALDVAGADPVVLARHRLAGGDPAIAAAVAAAERARRLEVRVARRCSDDAAGRDIEAARRLASDLRPVRDSWEAGRTTGRHAWVLADRTAGCSAETIAEVLSRLGDRWETASSNQLGRQVGAVLCRVDPLGVATRARRSRTHDLGVMFRALPHGLGQIIATHRVEDARAMMERLDDDADAVLAHRRSCEPCAAAIPDEIGPARAAAHVALVLADESVVEPVPATEPAGRASSRPAGAATPDPTSTDSEPRPGRARRVRRSRRGELQVVVDLATLLGLAENPGLLGGEPVPADLARELAAEFGSMRRIVTDPVTGHLLDYGTRVYLPEALRRFVAARDGTCRSPGCGQPAARCQLDHVVPFPHGPSDVANTHTYCKRDHDTKSDGGLTVLAHSADGACRWQTRHGQYGVTPPRPYLPDHEPPPF